MMMAMMLMVARRMLMMSTVYDSSWRTLLLKNWPELEARSPTGMSKSLQPNVEFDFGMIKEHCWNDEVKDRDVKKAAQQSV